MCSPTAYAPMPFPPSCEIASPVPGSPPDGYSGHSLRTGLATSAIKAGVPNHKVRAQTGHASDLMLSRYARDAGLFDGNAAGALL